MRDWMGKVVVALVLTLLLLPGVSYAVMEHQKALVGLKEVSLLVMIMQPEIAPASLTRDQLETEVALRIRKAGVKVLTEKERGWGTTSRQYFKVTVSTLVDADTLAPWVHILEVQLRAYVTHDNGFMSHSTVWEPSGPYGIKEPMTILRAKDSGTIRERVINLVDEFIDDYLAANPKK